MDGRRIVIVPYSFPDQESVREPVTVRSPPTGCERYEIEPGMAIAFDFELFAFELLVRTVCDVVPA